VPARLANLVRALKQLGVAVNEPSKGSHRRATRGGELFTIPAHNGLKTEIDDKYIRALCRKFGLDEAALRALL